MAVTFYNDPNIPDIIELKNVNQTYDGGKSWVIKDCNLLIESPKGKNKFITILGPSGCGKSTILRYIAGLQSPTSGEVLLNEHIRKETDVVGMVFQKYSSFHWLTVLENVALGLEFARVPEKQRLEKATKFLEIVGLENHADKFAQYPQLSGGQLQRVAIARSLVIEPSILLLDEPFGALDINTRSKMQDLVLDMFDRVKDMTFILVTHDIPEAVYLSDEIWIMRANPGYIVERIDVTKILPDIRNKALKKSKNFQDMVNKIEDLMENLETIKDK